MFLDNSISDVVYKINEYSCVDTKKLGKFNLLVRIGSCKKQKLILFFIFINLTYILYVCYYKIKFERRYDVMLKSFYPVLMLDKIREQADFFINFLILKKVLYVIGI